MLTAEQMLFLAMCLVRVDTDDWRLKAIRERFMKRDKQWSESDAIAELRLQEAEAIMNVWKRATT
jgi:hypothetical protein